jgi:predicted RNA methylase
MATKKTWDDVLRERGFDPEERKRKQAAKQTLDLSSNKYTSLESLIRQVSGVEQAQRAAAEADAIKSRERLKMLTLGRIDLTKMEKPPMVKPEAWREAIMRLSPNMERRLFMSDEWKEMIKRNTPSLSESLPRPEEANAYAEKSHKEQEKLHSDKEEKKPWYKKVGESIKGLFTNINPGLDPTAVIQYAKEKAPVVKNQLAFTKEDIAKALGSGIFGDEALDKYERAKKPGLRIPGWAELLGFANYVDYIYNKLENLNNGEPMTITLEEALSSPVFTDAKKHFDRYIDFGMYRTSRNAGDALKAWWETTKGTGQTLAGMALEALGATLPDEEMDTVEWSAIEGKKLRQKGAESFQKAGQIREEAIKGEGFLTKVHFDIVQNIPDLLISAIIALGTGGTGAVAKEGAKQAAKSVATTAGKKFLLKEVAKKAGKALLIAPDTLPLALKSYASSYQENIAKGWDEDKAISNALLKAYGEGLLEKGGLQSFIKSPDKGVVAWLASGAFEGSEEITQDMWSNIIDNLFGEDEPLLTGDSLYSGLIGALTGWLIGAPAMADTSPDIKVNDNKISVKDREGKTHTADLDELTVEQLETLSEHPVIQDNAKAKEKIDAVARERRTATQTDTQQTDVLATESPTIAPAETKTEETTIETKEPEATEAEAQKETETKTSAQQEQAKTVPAYEVGDTVTLKHGDITRTIAITEIGPTTIKGVTDKGTTIQYVKKIFENSIVNVVKARTESEARTTVQPIPAEKMGNETVMLTNDGTEIKARYAVVSADELITSHNTDMSVNPNYPQELQPRQRERAASIVEVDKMSKNIQPELLGENIKISDGAPIVGDDGIVESGNGRVIALKKMYESGNDAKYREWLEANKDKFGITGELPDKPVLVRVRTTDVDRVAFTKMANESSVAAMSATETARSDAEKISDDLLNLFVPNDEGAINTPENKTFIQRFLNDVVPSNEHARLVTKEGLLSQDGYNRIRNALFYRAYGDLELLDMLTEDLDAELKNVIKAMVANAPRIALIKQGIKDGVYYDLDFSDDIVYAAKQAIALKRKGMKVAEFVNQVSMFEGPTNVQREILTAFEKYNRSAKRINMFIRFISDAVIAAGNPDQIAMFDNIAPTKDAIMETALRRMRYELEGVVEGQTVMPVLQTEYEGSAETVRTDATEGAESVEVTAKELQTEAVRTGDAIWKNKDFDQPVKVTGFAGEYGGRKYVNIEGSNTAIPLDEIEFAPMSIDTSKYGRSGKAAFKRLSQNEYINADLTKPENEYTQKWIQLFDKYYNLGRENKPMPLTFEQGELEAEFPPFILDEIYRAGKADYEAQQKKEAKKDAATKEKETKVEINQEKGGIIEGDTPAAKIAEWVKQKLSSGERFTFADLTKIANEAFGGTQAEGKYIAKDAYDAMELGINKYLLKQTDIDFTVDSAEQAKENVQKLRDLLDLIPTQTRMSEEQLQYQQFSTPPNIAYIVSWLANINENDVVLEPSAGIGGLAIFAKANDAKVIVNELSDRRLALLKNLQFDEYFNENAEQINNILGDKIKPTVVIMNPPFSATAGRMGDKRSTKFAKAHIEQALKILQPGGRLVAIVGQGMSSDSSTFRDWWSNIEKEYNVRANVGVYSKDQSGRIKHTDEYKKYGTTYGIQIIVIDKTGPTTSDVITANEPSLENIIDLLEGIRNDIGQRGTVQLGEAEQETSKPVSEKGTGKPESGDMGVLSPSVTGDEGSVSSVRADNGTSQVRTGSDTGRNAGYSEQESVQVADNTVRGGHSERSGRRDTRGQTDADIRGSRGELEREPSVAVTDGRIKTEIKSESELEKELAEIEKESNAVYSKYIPQKVKIEGAKEHPSELVESAAMSAVAPPDPTYSPNLPENVIRDGLLSLPQLESVIYAGQAHSNILPDGTRKGFFIGDGTGVGKGRTIAGIIMDNFRQGRIKAVWVSENKKLFKDATRDWTGIGGNKDDLFDLGKFKINQSIERKSGILFTTYDTLKSESRDAGRVKQSEYDGTRLKQIVDWLGKDFDGAIIFDEAHNMASAVEYGRGLQKKKTSKKALAGLELQSLLPNARVVYASATGATDVHNLAYAPRLGLWGEGTPFRDVRDFIDQISSGGLAAMELIARDMKSMGSYLARNISFEGVEYEALQHDLSPIQREMYDKYCEAWQIVLNNINEALEITGQAKNSRKRSNIISQFWSNNQRFFNQVITSMAMPSVIQDIKNELKNGNSVIIQLVNTNEAAFNRAISNVSGEDVNLEDIDLSPTDILLQYIEKAFPVQQYEEYVDDNGKERSRPVYDSKGNPVLNKEAVAAKESLISDIKEMKLPDGALEIILDTFGPDQVAEVTGRTRRMIRKKDEKTGELKRVIEKWSESKSNADVKAFQDGKKRILVFSDAGSTGMSYHADRNAKNQQKRIHYLLQPGWNAIKATQGFGRSHRSNQVVAPKFKLVTTDLKGQKRFISTIARRLDQLGALTKGQRQAGSGIFSEKDNLEGPLASDTLQRFFRDLFQNNVDGLELDGKKVLRDMGLYEYLTDKYGNYKDDATITRDTRRFLNRVLNLKYADQNAIFEAFYERMERNFQEALENGTLDVGLENYKAEKIVVKDEHVIRKDNTGAETKYLELTAYRKPAILMFDTLQNYDNFIGLYRNKETGEVRAVLRSANKTLENGEVTKTYRLLSPLYGKESKYIEKTLNAKMEEISKKEWRAAWLSEIEKLPEYTEENLHMLTGTLLPIWNKLPKGNMRIVRIVDDKGKAYLGRLIAEEQIAETLRRFSVAKDIKYDPADVFNKVLKEGYTVTFDNTPPMTIKRKKVSGEYRIELSGGDSWWYARKIPGIITEQIGYNRRYFIPVDERGSQIIAELMKDNSIKSVKKGIIETEDETSVQSFSSIDADMPKGDGSSVTSKTVDDLIKIIEKHTGVPIRTGKYRQRARGIFKVNPEVIRTKVRGDLPAIAHELGHYLDKKFKFSSSQEFKNELMKLGIPASKPRYSAKQIRAEGIAEFVRLYLTNPVLANKKAPEFMAHFEKSLDADTLSFLATLRKEISAIKGLPYNKRIWNSISSGESRRSNRDSLRFIHKFYDAWIDETGPFARMQSYAESKGWEGQNLELMVKLYKGMASKVKSNLFYAQRNLDGEVVGESLAEILEPLSPKEVKKRTGKRSNSIQEKKDFITYMVSRRAMDYKDRGLVMPDPWYVYEDNIIAMEEKYPHFAEIFAKLRQWENNNLQLLIDSGLKTAEEIEIIKFMNANHVPLHRIRDAAESIRPGSGTGLGQTREVLRRATGSGATIIDPLESMIVDAFIIRRAAEANRIFRTLYEMSKLEGIGKMVEVIPPKSKMTTFTVEEIRGQLLKSANAEIEAIKSIEISEEQQKALAQAEAYKDAIVNMSDEQLEAVMSIYRPLYQEKDNQVVAYVDGKKVLMEVDPHLFRAIKRLNHQQAGLIMRLLGKIKRVRVATIVTDMVFVLRNVVRDFGTSLMQSEAGITPWDIIRGYMSVAAKDQWYKEYLAAGGAIDFSSVSTRRQAQKLVDEVLQYTLPEKAAVFIEAMGECLNNNNARTRDKLKNAAKALIEIPIDMTHDAVEWSEHGARVAEFRKAIEKLGVDKDTAASWGRKLSVDFLRHGYAAKQVNQAIAFFNPNLQGAVRIGETLKSHPLRTFVRGFVYITLPTLLLYALNYDDEDYQDLPEYRRALFYNIPIGGGKYIPIPKPPGWGWIFGAVPEFLMNKLLKDDPEAWEEIMSTFWQSFSLPTEITAVSPILDILANKKWTGAPVEGQYERKNKPAYLIRDSKTSLLASIIGDIAKNEKGLSPKQIDYLITQYLGNIGTTLWQLPDTIKAIKETPTDVTNYPIIKAFITDAAFSTEAINDLYEIGEELNLRRKELIETGEYPAMSHHPIEKQKELFVALEAARAEYNEIAKLYEEARKAIKEIQEDESLTPAVKKLKERQIRLKMNKIARDFNSKYRQFKKDNDIK